MLTRECCSVESLRFHNNTFALPLNFRSHAASEEEEEEGGQLSCGSRKCLILISLICEHQVNVRRFLLFGQCHAYDYIYKGQENKFERNVG